MTTWNIKKGENMTLEEAKEKITDLNGKLESSLNKIERLTGEKEQLENDKTILEQSLADKTKEVEKLTQVNEEVSTKLDSLRDKNFDLLMKMTKGTDEKKSEEIEEQTYDLDDVCYRLGGM